MAGIALQSNNANSSGDLITIISTITDYSFGPICACAALLLFFSQDINRHWQSNTAPSSSITRCPICGEAKAGLIDHIRAVHGKKSLKKPRIKRALEKAQVPLPNLKK